MRAIFSQLSLQIKIFKDNQTKITWLKRKLFFSIYRLPISSEKGEFAKMLSATSKNRRWATAVPVV